MERAAAGIGLQTEYMCYNQTGNIATLDGASLKLVDKFTEEVASHQPKKTSTHDWRRHGRL